MRISDWSSDVCPSDLQAAARCAREARMGGRPSQGAFRADRSADGGTLAPAAGPGRVTGLFAVGWWLGHLARLDHMGCRGDRKSGELGYRVVLLLVLVGRCNIKKKKQKQKPYKY